MIIYLPFGYVVRIERKGCVSGSRSNSGNVGIAGLSEYFKQNRGAQIRLAKSLGLRPSTVSQWKSVPANHVVKVSAFTGIPREDLRPDVFAEPAE